MYMYTSQNMHHFVKEIHKNLKVFVEKKLKHDSKFNFDDINRKFKIIFFFNFKT